MKKKHTSYKVIFREIKKKTPESRRFDHSSIVRAKSPVMSVRPSYAYGAKSPVMSVRPFYIYIVQSSPVKKNYNLY